MVADEVVETPYAVCKTAVLAVELIGNSKYASRCDENRLVVAAGFEPADTGVSDPGRNQTWRRYYYKSKIRAD